MDAILAWASDNWLGLLTITVSLTYICLGLPHQIYVMWTKKSVEGVSVGMFILLAIQCLLWVAYGYARWDVMVMIANSFGAFFAIIITISYFAIKRNAVHHLN